MNQGRVYLWIRDPEASLGGTVSAAVVPLERLDPAGERGQGLSGQHVYVRNGGSTSERDPDTGTVRAVALGNAEPNAEGDFIFEPGIGGGRMDKALPPDPGFLSRYAQAAHFGEVNTYYHLDRIAAYITSLLGELGAGPLPRAVAVVNAHHAATERDGIRDGVRRGGRWAAFQGGHYRLPCASHAGCGPEPLAADGEIHLGPGRELLREGALPATAGRPYRSNASHNAGILYHEYGHHITRHTADFSANTLRSKARQDNRKPAIDEGTSDYWAAVMLETPDIWVLHRRHTEREAHPRSLRSRKTMADFDWSAGADPHANGTIWAAALWDLRSRMASSRAAGARRADLVVLQSLLFIGELGRSADERTAHRARAVRQSFRTALMALLRADAVLDGGRNAGLIGEVFAEHGVHPPDRAGGRRIADTGTLARSAERAPGETGAAGGGGRT